MKSSIFGTLIVSMALTMVGCGVASPRDQVNNYAEAFYAAESNIWQCTSDAVAKHDLLVARADKSEAEQWIDSDYLSEPERVQLVTFQREREECQNEFRLALLSSGYSLTHPINTESWMSMTNAVTSSLLAREITWGQFFKINSDKNDSQQSERDLAIRNMWDDAVEQERAFNQELSRAFQQAATIGTTGGGATVQCKKFGDISLAPVVYTFNATQCPVGYSPL